MEFIHLLIRINEIFHGYITQYKEEFIGKSDYSDVTVNQLIYLEAIFQLGSPTVSRLADHLRISKASASIGVAKLINSRLVEKTQSADDSRVHYVHLSGEGKKLIEAEVKAMAAFAERIQGRLSDDEVRQLVRIFQKVVSDKKE